MTDARKVRLTELLTIEPQAGLRQATEGPDPELPFIATGMVSSGASTIDSMPTEITRARVKDRIVEDGDLLLVSRGIERFDSVPCSVVRLPSSATFSASLIRLSPQRDVVDSDYLRLFLTSRQGSQALRSATTGSTISNLRRDAVEQVEVWLPELDEQRSIASSLKQLDDRRQELEELTECLRQFFDVARERAISKISAAETPTRALLR